MSILKSSGDTTSLGISGSGSGAGAGAGFSQLNTKRATKAIERIANSFFIVLENLLLLLIIFSICAYLVQIYKNIFRIQYLVEYKDIFCIKFAY
jgi:hypothetical protein